jgi:hypothetical protein
VFDRSAPEYQRLAIVYLMFVCFTYFWVAFSGFFENAEMFTSLLADAITIPPFTLFHLVVRCALNFPCTLYDFASPGEFPTESSESVLFLFGLQIVLSVVGVIAGFALSKKSRWAYAVWTGLVTLSIVTAFVNIVADHMEWRALGLASRVSPVAIRSVLWSMSYVAAYWLARRGNQPAN